MYSMNIHTRVRYYVIYSKTMSFLLENDEIKVSELDISELNAMTLSNL